MSARADTSAVARPPETSVTAPKAARPLPGLVNLACLALFVVTVIPRLIGLEQHLTADEQYWVRRVVRFSLALQQADWRRTYQIYHPGVPVLWIGSLGIGPQRAAELGARAGQFARLEKTPSYLGALFDARRAMVLVSALLTVGLAVLTWRLFGFLPAALAGLLMAGEPFLVAHSRVLHIDSLLGQLMVSSTLAALVFLRGRGSRSYLVASGGAAGLALLTKAPGVFLFGFIPLLFVAFAFSTWFRQVSAKLAATGRAGELRLWSAQLWQRYPPVLEPLVRDLVIWALAAGVVFVALWPALWVAPFTTLGRMIEGVREIGGSAHIWGNFFLGQAIKGDVGPLFYPVATLLRLSPLTLLGLLLLGWFTWRDPRANLTRPIVALLAFVALFALMVTLSPKKMDRYLLPAYSIFCILAALGIARTLHLWRGPVQRWLVVGAIGVAQLGLVATVQPYPLSFHNPLFGGISTARQTIVVGWGEGLDQVAAYLDTLPDAENLVASTLYHDLVHPQFRGTAVPPWEWRRADYWIQYVNMDQRELEPAALRRLVEDEAPVFTARVNGLDYARVYRIPPELKAGASQPSTPPSPAESDD